MNGASGAPKIQIIRGLSLGVAGAGATCLLRLA